MKKVFSVVEYSGYTIKECARDRGKVFLYYINSRIFLYSINSRIFLYSINSRIFLYGIHFTLVLRFGD